MKELQVFGLTVYPFGLALGALSLIALVWSTRVMEKQEINKSAISAFPIAGATWGFAMSRLIYCLCIIDLIISDFGQIFRFHEGGMSFYGALLGIVIAALLIGRATKESTGKILDSIIVPACILIVAMRLIGGFFVQQGVGMNLESWFDPEETDMAYRYSLFRPESWSFFERFPFSIAIDGIWYWAVFVLEAFSTLVIGIVASRMRNMEPGGKACAFVALLSGVQIILEAMKRKNVLYLPYLGFVKANLVFGLIAILCVFIVAVRKIECAKKTGQIIRGILLIAVGALIVTTMEFAAFEKKITLIASVPADVCHVIMCIGCALMLIGVMPAVKKGFSIK